MGASGNPAKRSAMERAKAEAARSAIEELDETFTATLAGKAGEIDIEVPSYLDWEDGALAAIQRGDFRAWAEMALDEENLVKWISVRPTNRSVAEFFDTWEAQTGEGLGESQAS